MLVLDPRIKNILWMGAEKGISFIGVFIITAAMAKYIGPHYYGVISYAVSIFSLIYIISAMGSDPVIIKKGAINRRAGKLRSLYFTIVRTVIYVLLSVVFFIYLWIDQGFQDTTLLILLVSVFLSQFLLSIDYISVPNNYTLQSKINTIANVTGLLIALLIRFFFVKFNVSIYLFSIPIILSPAASFLLKLIIFDHEGVTKRVRKIINFKLVFTTVKILAPFAVSSIAANIYNRMPLLLITSLLGYSLSGIYSCALSLSTAWSFFPNSLISSYIPKFYNNKSNAYLSQVIMLVCILCSIISLMVYLISPFVINYLYGHEYQQAIKLIPFILMSTTLSMMGNALYHYFIEDKGYAFLMIKSLICAVLSFALGYISVKYLGLVGAALSLLLIEFISFFVLNAFYKKLQPLHIIKNAFSISSIKSLKKM